ncbi:N-acetyl-gamma-glutamyl-phosphate reductase [Trichinella spiralis]|uniref:N-acetyl-gamma-glutamyl-phosphate reductase n=1 Tax=Trichinella spiralis TaxID=6334 RepID=A0ABR3KK59_TRISP
MEKNTAESVDELNKKSMNQMAGADMKHQTNKGSEIEENDYDAQGALKEVLPNEEQNFNKEEGIEEASLIIAVDVDSKNINESDTVSGEQRHVEMANSIEESASLQGSSITADGMSSTSDVDSNSNSGDVGIVENEHLDREKRLGPLKFVDEDSESLKGEEVRKASQEVAIIEAEEVFEKASWSIDISENSTSDIKVSNSINTIEIFEHKQFDNERFLKPLMPDDDFSQRSSYDSNFIHQHSNYSRTFSSGLASYDIFASVSSSIEDSVIEDSVPTYSQNFGISICEYLSGNSQIRENSFLDFGSQTAESSEDATTASEWILIEEKASEVEKMASLILQMF